MMVSSPGEREKRRRKRGRGGKEKEREKREKGKEKRKDKKRKVKREGQEETFFFSPPFFLCHLGADILMGKNKDVSGFEVSHLLSHFEGAREDGKI